MFHAMNNFKRERNDTINEIIVKLFFKLVKLPVTVEVI